MFRPERKDDGLMTMIENPVAVLAGDDVQTGQAVFVYGTLRPGGGNFPMIVRYVEGIWPATVRDHSLWGAGAGFPVMTPTVPDDPNYRVVGDVLWFPAKIAAEALRLMDNLEGVPSHYQRVLITANVYGQSQTRVWSYVQPGVPTNWRGQTLRLIESGDWQVGR